MQHLANTAKPLDVRVKGNSLLPYCHFDLDDSDYMVSRRPKHNTNISLDDGTKVLEFTSTGTSSNILKYVIERTIIM